MNDIIFISSLLSTSNKNKIYLKSKGAIANANDTLQLALLKGLSINCKKNQVKVLNMPNIGAYPVRYKDLYYKGCKSMVSDIEVEDLSFFNLLFIKHYFKYIKIKNRLLNILKEKNSTNNIVIIYDLYEPFLHALYTLKNKFKFKTFVIVPDLLGYTGVKNNLLHNLNLKKTKQKVFKELSIIDGYILLCDQMKEKLPMQNKPYIVIEGIYDNTSTANDTVNSLTANTNNIFYSGAIDERNGILLLLEAFSYIPDSNYRLIICGEGYSKNDVLIAARRDKRIIYKGQLPHNEVLSLQKNCATLLVNPRQPIGEFTKYSFPSKTMEYFASGTPVLMYKLPGVPNDYYNYCYTIEKLDALSLSKQIMTICEQDKNVLNAKGIEARNFILKSKNPKAQTSKLLEFILNI